MNSWISIVATAVLVIPGSFVLITWVALDFAKRLMAHVPEEDRCHAILQYDGGATRRCIYAEGHAGPHFVPEDKRFYEAHWN